MTDIPSSIGVLVDGSVVVRSFRGDCWSEMTANGRLKKTRHPVIMKYDGEFKGHRESFGKPDGRWIQGIVVRGGYYHLKGYLRHDIRQIAEEFNLPVYELVKNFELRQVHNL